MNLSKSSTIESARWYTGTEVAKALDIRPFMLSRWRKEYREGKIVADIRKKITDMAQSKKELSRIKRLEQVNA